MEINVISLKRTPDRLAGFMRANPSLDTRLFDAIDGLTLSSNDPRVEALGLHRMQWSAGAIGSCLSHMSLWRRAVSSEQAITVCEDDAIFHCEFSEIANSLIGKIQDWDLILWGWNFDSILWLEIFPGISPASMIFDQNLLRNRIDKFSQENLSPYVLRRLLGGYGLPAYSVSPTGARKLLRSTTPIRPISPWSPILNRHVTPLTLDIVLNTIYPSIESWVCFPPLVATPNIHEVSTIQNSNIIKN